MAGRRTSKPGGTRWFPISEVEVDTLDALAASTQAIIADVEIEDRGTGVAYTGGAVVSYRLWVDIKPEAVIEMGPTIHVLIVPAGETVLSLVTAALLKKAEHQHWAMMKLVPSSGDPAVTSIWTGMLEIKTARRFRQADRFVVVMINKDDSVAFGAAAVGSILVDAYVRPD